MKKSLLFVLLSGVLAVVSACAPLKTESERMGYSVAITVVPDYPVARFPATVNVAVTTPQGVPEAGALDKVELKLISENASQMEVLRVREGATPGTYTAPVDFAFGGMNNLIFSARMGDLGIYGHELVTVGGGRDPGPND